MIELPRACFVADRIAAHADFFSFGTNDLTQTALGFSRDDVEGRFLNRYVETKIVDRSPFETIDRPGVGWLVRLGAWTGREAKPDLKLGICGEHGGDPESIALLPDGGARLRELLALPGADRARGGGASGATRGIAGKVPARHEHGRACSHSSPRSPSSWRWQPQPPSATWSAAPTGRTRRLTRA